MSNSQTTRHTANNVKNKIFPRRHSSNHNHRKPLPSTGPPGKEKVKSLWMVAIGW